MKSARNLAVAIFVLGLALLAVGIACGADASETPAPTPEPSPAVEGTPTPTATPTARPSQTPTPTPFDGRVARIKIPRFGVDAPIEELGVDSTNTLETPKDENRAVGWYYIYDKPGWGGNAIFSAHVYYHSQPAPFVNLAKSQPGDIVVVVMEDGTEYLYEVFSNTRYHRDTIPMGEIIDPPQKPDYDEWVTLITCGGELDATGLEYLHRDVVVAKRIWE